jgi:pimeloyl-ACP methyl ester carboxylesterase
MKTTRNSFRRLLLLLSIALPTASLAAGDLDGLWYGEARIEGTGVFIQVDLRTDDDQKRAAVVTIPLIGSLGVAADEIRSTTGGVVITVRSPVLGAEIAMEDPVGASCDATLDFITGPQRSVDLPPAGFTMRRIPRIRELPGATRHDGILELPGNARLPVTLVFARSDGEDLALIDIPAQGLQGLVLLQSDLPESDDPVAMASIESHPEARAWRLALPVEAILLVRPEGDSWSGELRQGPFEIPIGFERAAAGAAKVPRRPQDPVPPLPYAEVEVEIATGGGHVLAATLVIPGSDRPEHGYPAAVLVTGSGPQNRDEELMGHRPFRVLADRLARKGIASLRYDDRGIAGSTGDFATATGHDFADDAASALRHLQQTPGIDCDRCGLAGHSEGGTVAAMVAAGLASTWTEADPAFLVSIAGTGVDGGRIMSDQVARIYRAAGVDEQAIAGVEKIHREVMDLVRNDEVSSETLRLAVRELQESQIAVKGEPLQEKSIQDLHDDQLDVLEAAAMSQMKSPWMRNFIRFDPADAWRRVRVPILAVNGTLDLQVWHDLNLPAIQRAVREAGGRVDVVRLDGLNHLLQPTETGSPDEYGVIDITMDEKAMELIAEWIVATPRIPPATRGRRP